MAGPAGIPASLVMTASFLLQQAAAACADSVSLIKQRMCRFEVLNWFYFNLPIQFRFFVA